MMPINVHDLEVDTYATTCHKWLCSPAGTGLLYVRREMQERIWPNIVTENWWSFKDARKYEHVSRRPWPVAQERPPADLAGDAPLGLQDRERPPDRGPRGAQVGSKLPLRRQLGAAAQAGPPRLDEDDLGQPVPLVRRIRRDVPGWCRHPRRPLYLRF